ncbi:glycosyltransferase family 2 protein [Frigidibacter sp. ROC022]|uniref:glycosyltransferase family 2 protein n=1 Tax=Frigidibacter sp. ROC022 TaxID=2971796 RepID=UPI00215A5051|nr:glycosyltransferase family 2 protein [Frigidibacter sp. ROC022]MCR8725873.1 glycosyltransferase [Frigidibacter sp. ROC022]
MVRFSVITATYNLIDCDRIDSFRKAVASVRAQTHADIEHIVVDGASTDGTAELLNRMFADGEFDILISEPDQGVYDAMNRGVDAASGDFVLFLNSDDSYHDPNGLSDLARHSAADFIASPVVTRSERGDRILAVSKGFARVLLTMPFNHQGLAVRRELFHRLDGFDLAFRIGADYDFILRMLMSGARGARTCKPFVTYLEGGLSSDRTRAMADGVAVWLKNYSAHADLSRAEWESAMARRIVPVKLCRAMLLDASLPFVIRRSALVQLGRAMLKGSGNP